MAGAAGLERGEMFCKGAVEEVEERWGGGSCWEDDPEHNNQQLLIQQHGGLTLMDWMTFN